MNETLIERYRAALRAGHVAVRKGRLEDAADAYRGAIELGPDRAVPRVSLGGVCLRLGEPAAALEAYDAALERSPDDDAAILGRAQALVVLRRPAEAALAYDRLAEVRAAGGRPGEACDALRRALEIEPNRVRRGRYQELAGELRLASGDAEAERALELARGLLAEPTTGTGAAGVAGIGDATAPEAGSPGALPMPPPPDGEALSAMAEEAEDRTDVAGALDAAMAAARAFREAGHPVAAIDALLRVQPLAPGDRELHILLAELQADRGWTAVAAQKLRHVARLAELDGDPEAAARILGTGGPADSGPADAEPADAEASRA